MSQSMCLTHQERETVARCVVCARPMCSECRVEIEGKPYCGFECHEKAKEASARLSQIQAEEEALRKQRAAKRFYVNSLMFIGIVALVIAWPHLPKGLTEPVVNLFNSIKAAFSGG